MKGLGLGGSIEEVPDPGWVSREGNPWLESRGEGCRERKSIPENGGASVKSWPPRRLWDMMEAASGSKLFRAEALSMDLLKVL